MKNDLFQKINWQTFLFPAVIISIVVLAGILTPVNFSKAAHMAFAFITEKFGWLYLISSVILIVFCLWAGFSKYGKIRLGGKDAKPEMSFFIWFCIALTSGMGIGIGFFGVAEPLGAFISPPEFTGWEGFSPAAAEGILGLVYMHWCLHPYAIYTSVGIVCAFMYWNAKKKFEFTSAFYPVLGRYTDGIPGKLLAGLCVFAAIGSVGTSLGLGVSQLSTGVNYVFGTNYSDTSLAVFIISGMALFYIASACTGLHKGIKHVSTSNMYLFFILMAWAFLFGGSSFIVNNTVTGLGQYLGNIIPQSFYLEPAVKSGWVGSNTIFYYAAWIAIAPLVGLFLVKLAKGRTIRQFVVVNMLAPSLFAVLWFGIFGSSSIKMTMDGTGIEQELLAWGSPASLFIYIKELPLPWIMTTVSFLAIIFSFVTMAEALTLTIADMTTKEAYLNEEKGMSSPIALRIFWGGLMALIAFALFYSGGLQAIQTSSIVCALPISVMLLVMAVSYVKCIKNIESFDLTSYRN